MKMLGKLVVSGVVVFAAHQVIRPAIPARPAAAEIQAPVEIRQILQKDCYSCHSDQRRLAWFDQIVPAYWLVRHDILTAREHLDFETIGSRPAAAQRSTLFEAVNMIQLGAMPLPRFTQLHPEAKVSPDELSVLKSYLAPWSTTPPSTPTEPLAGALAPIALASVPPEFNGVAFDPAFESWKPISTTDRGDNNTFRFILGNDIAIKAAKSGNITPWPDGSRFAKVAWQQETGPDGFVRPGKFVQVELMIKDAKLYKSTEGWGWGRWRGFDLKPYGKDAKFATECTTCHLPVKGDDFVYTLSITQARIAREEAVNKRAAALPASLPFHPLAWNAITMYVDPRTHTTATLYGNEAAMAAVQARGAAPTNTAYPAGSVLALVTWVQREDPHWFGGRIPDNVQSVEFIQPGSPNPYRRFAGSALAEETPDSTTTARRAAFVTSLTPARLP